MKRILIFLVLSPLLIGANLFALTESEPNNSIKSANWISLGVVTGEISSNNDEDYFQMRLPELGMLYLDIEAEAIGSPLDAKIEIYRRNGAIISTIDNVDCSYDPEIVFVAPEDGIFFFKVFSSTKTGGPGYKYNLYLSTVSVGTDQYVQEDLSNDFISGADEWPIPSIIYGMTFHDDGTPDSDYFMFKGKKGQKVIFDIWATRNEQNGAYPSSLEARLSLYEWDGTSKQPVLIAESIGVNKQDPQIIHTYQKDGPLYLKVADAWGEDGTNHYYILFVYELPFLHEVPDSIYANCKTIPQYRCGIIQQKTTSLSSLIIIIGWLLYFITDAYLKNRENQEV